MGVNKIIFGGETVVDLTSDTVTPETLAVGITAHDKSGNLITGTMQGGGGGSEENLLDAFITNTLTDLNCGAPSVAAYGCRGRTNLVTVTLPNAKSVGAQGFYNCTKLTTVNLPIATSIGSEVFYGCSKLATVDLSSATSIGEKAFYNCSVITSITLPVATSVEGSTFYKCTKLKKADLGAVTSIGASGFINCSALVTVILRYSGGVVSLANTNAFSSTPVKSGGTGYVYVPSALVDSYKSATNWSSFATQIRAIEDYPDICG